MLPFYRITIYLNRYTGDISEVKDWQWNCSKNMSFISKVWTKGIIDVGHWNDK